MPSNRRKKNIAIPKQRKSDKSDSNDHTRTSTTNTAVKSGDVPNEASFEKELCWCVQQLELGLATQKPTAKQAEDAVKVLKVLKNPKASLVRKRQVMRNTFGDYRQKIAQEERQALADAKGKMKVSPAPTRMLQQSVFYKKSNPHIDKPSGPVQCVPSDEPDDDFRFNFKEQNYSEESAMEACEAQSKESKEALLPFIFQPSSEPFRFNFGGLSQSHDEEVSQTDFVPENRQMVPSSTSILPGANVEHITVSEENKKSDKTVPCTGGFSDQIAKEPASEQADALHKKEERETCLDSDELSNSENTKTAAPCINKQGVISTKSKPISETDETYCNVHFGDGNFKFNFQSLTDNVK